MTSAAILEVLSGQAATEEALRPLSDVTGPEALHLWQAVNNGVMGVVSDGRSKITDDETLEFFGTLSPEDSGGFASVRTKPTAFGRRVQGMGPVEPDQIDGLGFMLSDKKPGTFAMRVEWVKVERVQP